MKTMQLIEQELHFWELYKNGQHYYLSIAVDMSSVVSCWDLVLNDVEVMDYQIGGRKSIQQMAKTLVANAYRGDFSMMDSRLASVSEKEALQFAYKKWNAKNIS